MEANLKVKSSLGTFNVDEAQGIVECFVAAVGNKDSVGDIVMPGAFTASLRRRKPRVVWGHDWNQPIGKVLDIYEVPASDTRLPAKMKAAGVGGLYARVQFNLKSERGREAFHSIVFFGEEQEWSIGYKTLDSIYSQERSANLLKEVELYEVSPVLHGANQLTATISIKSEKQEDKVDSFRKSKWKVFDPDFAEMVRTKHPDIWGKGGNIKGNDQYRALLPIYRKGGKATSEAEINALELREAWVARHAQDFQLAGVVAQIKWLAVGSRGEGYMKDVIREAIAKKEQKQESGSAGTKGVNPAVAELISQLSDLLKDGDGDFDDMLGDLVERAGAIHAEMEHDDEEDDDENESGPKMVRRVMSVPDAPVKGDCGCGCGGSCATDMKAADPTPCWEGYEMIGMKPGKNGEMVPNCVPIKGKGLYDDEAGISMETSSEHYLATELSALLGRVVSFYFKSHAAHWNVEGSDFAQYHSLFGEIYADVQASIDGWAENIRKLGHPAPGSLFEFGMNQTPETRSAVAPAGALARELLADNDALIAAMKRAFTAADDANEQGIADFIAGRIDVHQKWRWFLSASLKNAEIKSVIDEIEVKAGRVIAGRNMQRLRQALDLLRQVVEEGDPQALQMKSAAVPTEYLVMDTTPESLFEIKQYLDDFADYHGAEVIVDEENGEWVAIEAKNDEMMNVVLDFFQTRQDEFNIKGFAYGESDVDEEIRGKDHPFDGLSVKARRPFSGGAQYDPDAIDGDDDQQVQDNTPFERPESPRAKKLGKEAREIMKIVKNGKFTDADLEDAMNGIVGGKSRSKRGAALAAQIEQFDPASIRGALKLMREPEEQPSTRLETISDIAKKPVRKVPTSPSKSPSVAKKPVVSKPESPAPAERPSVKPAAVKPPEETEMQKARRNGLPSAFELDQMEKTSGPLGSQGGGWYKDAKGQKYIVKPAKSEAHAQNELAAHLWYKHNGAPTDDTGIIERDGQWYIVKKAVQDKEGNLGQQVGFDGITPKIQREARKHFVTDTLASSWDVFGLNGDNVIIGPNGKLHRIDVGGSFQFRAQGGPKDSFNPDQPWVEPFTMRTSAQGQALYGDMSDNDVIEMLSDMYRKEKDYEFYQFGYKMERAGIDEETRARIEQTLVSRLKQIPSIVDEIRRGKADLDEKPYQIEGDLPSTSEYGKPWAEVTKSKVNSALAQMWDSLRRGQGQKTELRVDKEDKVWEVRSGLYASPDGANVGFITNMGGDLVGVAVVRQDGNNLDVPDVFVLETSEEGGFGTLDKNATKILSDIFGEKPVYGKSPLNDGTGADLIEAYAGVEPTPLNSPEPHSAFPKLAKAFEADTEAISSDDFYDLGRQWSDENPDVVANPFSSWLSDGQLSNGEVDRALAREQLKNLQDYFKREIGPVPDMKKLTSQRLDRIRAAFSMSKNPTKTEALLGLMAYYEWLLGGR